MNKSFLTILVLSLSIFNNSAFSAEDEPESTFNRVYIVFTNEESRHIFYMDSNYVKELGIPVLAEVVKDGVLCFKLIYDLANELTMNEIDALLNQKINPHLAQYLNSNDVTRGTGYEKIDNV